MGVLLGLKVPKTANQITFPQATSPAFQPPQLAKRSGQAASKAGVEGFVFSQSHTGASQPYKLEELQDVQNIFPSLALQNKSFFLR
jgi:hypothetical protein